MNGALSLIFGAWQAFTQFQAGEEEAAAQEYNAQVAEREANLIRQGAKLDEFRSRKQLKAFVSQQTAAYARSGVELTGSPLDVIQDTIANAELEIAIDQFNIETAAKGKESEAEMRRYYGKQAKTAQQIQAGTTLLATAGDFGSKYYVPKKTKVGE